MHQRGRHLMLTLNAFEGEHRFSARRAATIALASLGLVVATSATALAQRAAAQPVDDQRWYPWIGCWQRSGEPESSVHFTCVRPGADSSAEILTIADGTITARERLVVNGQAYPIDMGGCRG